MSGLGLGTSNPAVVPPGLPLGAATWAGGYWFDLVAQAGVQGDPLVAGVASLAGSKVLLPLSAPLINDTAIGGQRGCYVADTGIAGTQPRFTCDAAAPIFASGGSFCIGLDWRQSKVAPAPLWGARSSVGGVTDQVSGQTLVEKISFSWTTSVGVTTTHTGAIPLAYDYHRLIWDYDGATLRMYVDGVLDLAVAVSLPALAVNLFTLLAARSSAVFAAATGYARRFFLSPSSVAGIVGGIATVDAYLVGQDYTQPLLTSPKMLFGGDSIQAGYGGSLNVAGTRAYVLNKILTERLSIQAIGQFIQGTIQNRLSAAQGGASIASIRAFLLAALAADTGLGPGLITGMCGTNDAPGNNAPAMAAATLTLLNDVYAAAVAKNPAVWLAWSDLTDIQPGFPGATTVAPYNLLLTQPGGVFDSCAANLAGRFLRLGNNAALGPWAAGNYTDHSHPNVNGDNLIGPSQWAIIGPVLAAISPT